MDARNELYYSSPEEVVGIGGIDKVDFGCENDEDLNAYLIKILKEAKSVIDNYTKKTYTEVPEGIHGVARDYCLNVLANARTISQQNGSRMDYKWCHHPICRSWRFCSLQFVLRYCVC